MLDDDLIGGMFCGASLETSGSFNGGDRFTPLIDRKDEVGIKGGISFRKNFY